MIFDRQTLVSDRQAITATAVSTDTIDLGPITRFRDVGKGTPIPFRVQVVEAFNTLTSLTIALQVDDNTGFSSAKTVWSQVVPLAQLIAGAVFLPEYLPRGTDERYVRLSYTVTGTNPTLGRITAGVTMGNQTNE